jgi:hypothetical protein
MGIQNWFTRSKGAFIFLLSTSVAITTRAAVPITRLSTDLYSNPVAQHATEVEPDSYSSGNTIVSAFQIGRFFDGGATNTGFAISRDAGQSWIQGVLPGITTVERGPFDRASDPSVAFDAAHGIWMIVSLAQLTTPVVHGEAVVVSRSSDQGLTWSNPVGVSREGNSDKTWIVCDNFSSSPFFGHCYVQWSENGVIHLSMSSNGGLSWGASQLTADGATGVGGQPLVQPNGAVIVPFLANSLRQLRIVRSLNGGASWRNSFAIANMISHTVAGGLRTTPLPTAEVDGAGRIFVAWQDCRFRAGCFANDIVFVSSSDGLNWSSVRRIPIHGTTSSFDHFIPGLGVDKNTRGSTARLGLTYYYYPAANCTAATCALRIGFVGSSNGGFTWTPHLQLVDSMPLNWLARTNQGVMVGDYISTSFSAGRARPVFSVAFAPSSSGLLNQGIFTTASSLSIDSASEGEEPEAESDSEIP